MARRTKEEAIETRNLLLDTAETVFAQKGVSRTSLADIAEAAGLTRGAIYWHFKNKIDLFNAMTDRIRLPMERMIDEECAEPENGDPVQRMHEICKLVLKETARNERRRRVLDILFHKCEYTNEMLSVLERQREACADGKQRIMRDMERAIERGQLPAGLDTRRAAIMLHALVVGMMSDWLFLPDYDLGAECDAVVDGFFDMLRTSPAMLRPGSKPGQPVSA
ncbi:TetR family transcriptional regulator [Pandoraea faecigallinarum]|uniref:TetR family transcriptional regulator n=1 Tax=Pandoraea faecigallinarum TaxID=656179 RepID=A0A0H3WST8_9BURK|nr:TetR family transcriptional regulator [Pandoraea faecigallinarum]AKM29621.1 TetR family transcriptional regulator [Pandoraea faecigallinarum]